MERIIYLFSILSVCIFSSCMEQKQNNPYVLDIPDKVEISKMDRYGYVRIKGSCIFVIPPEGFIQMPKESVLTYKEACYMYFSDFNNRDVNDFIDLILKKLPETYTFEKDGYSKIIEMNGYKAFVAHLRYDDECSELSVSFGNQSYYGQIKCVYPLESTDLRDALLKSMLTAYIDTAFKHLAMEDMAYYTIDLSNTDFKLAYNANNTYIYTINGIDPTFDSEQDLSILITTMPYESPPEKIMKKIKEEDFYPYKIRKTLVNGYSGVEYYSEGAVCGETARSYSVIFGNGNTSLYVVGKIYNMDLYDECLAEIKRIIGTIRFKNVNNAK